MPWFSSVDTILPEPPDSTEQQLAAWDPNTNKMGWVGVGPGTPGIPSDGSVTTPKLADDAVTAEKIAPITATGSTEPRRIEDRFADVVNVLDHGAVGDGVTDNTAAIQSAMTASVVSGRPVYVPGGQYYIKNAETITLPENLSLLGASADTTTFIGDVTWPISSPDLSTNRFAIVDNQTLFVSGIKFTNFNYTFQCVEDGSYTLNSIEFSNVKWSECYAAMVFTANQRSARTDVTLESFRVNDIECVSNTALISHVSCVLQMLVVTS